jgi:hypothetical protein
MKVGVLTKNGIFFSSRPFLQETQVTSNLKVNKGEENPVKKLGILKDKLCLSDTGKVKTRLSYWDKNSIFNELNAILVSSHKASMISFIYANEAELINT